MRRLVLISALAACRLGFEDAARAGHDGAPDSPHADTPIDDADDAASLALYFAFDEPAGTGVAANAGYLGPATVAAVGQQGVAGMVGNAIRFASASDGLQLPDAAELDGFVQLTIEAWVFYDQLASSYSTVVKKDGAYILRTCDVDSCDVPTKRYISGIVWDSTNAKWISGAEITIVTSTWTHVALVYDGMASPRTVATYWNGALANILDVASGTGLPTFDSASPLAIGRAAGSGENMLGRLDELKLWTVARTDAQICASAGRTWSGTSCN